MDSFTNATPTISTPTNRTTAPLFKPSISSLKTLNPNLISTAAAKPSTVRFTITAAKQSPPPLLPSKPTPADSLKSRLRRGGPPLYGIFLLGSSPTMAEIASLAGYDYAVVDMEHSPAGIPQALDLLRALAVAGTPAVIRVPESSAVWAKKALDLGPQGIMFPMIDSPKDARKAVSYCRFPPRGIRGSAHTVVRASGYGIDEGYLSNYEESLVVMCQVESEDGAKKAAEIAAVDGVDCIQMGPLDLSADMGYLWDPGHKKVREMMAVAEKAVLDGPGGGGGGGAYLTGFAMPHDSPEAMAARGYHMVAGAVDVGLFRRAAVEDVRKFRMSVTDGGDETEEHGKGDDEKYWSE